LNHSHGGSPYFPTVDTTGYDRELLPVHPTSMDERPLEIFRGGNVVLQREAGWRWNYKECPGLQEWSQVRSISTLLTGRTETLVDPISSNVDDLLDSRFGDPLPTTIHITSLIERTVAILEQVNGISTSTHGRWEPIVVWEPYYVGLGLATYKTLIDRRILYRPIWI